MLDTLKRLFGNKKQAKISKPISPDKIPAHVAIITDGNGRWAKKRGLPRSVGHAMGMERVREITRAASDMGVKILTYYTFSTENWKRPVTEVEYLMKLPGLFFKTDLKDLMDQNIKVKILHIEDDKMPLHTQSVLDEFEKQTESNTGMILNMAFNYGSRDEIVNAVRKIVNNVSDNQLRIEEIDESCISDHLLTSGMVDPDLVIRTSGESRLSNFLLWQAAYSELLFTDTLWPDFTPDEFHKAIIQFQSRSRRYGDVLAKS